MNCETAKNLFPAAWERSLSGGEKEEFESHVAACLECRRDKQALDALWQRLGEVPPVQPGPAVRARFYAMLEGYEDGAKNLRQATPGRWTLPQWLRSPALFLRPIPVLLSAVLVVAGFAGGYALRAQRNGHEEMAALRQEVREMRKMVSVSLLQQQSASERLKGLSWSSQVNDADAEFLATLFHTLNYDQNVDVRLAAVDALARFAGSSGVSEGLVRALQRQESPLVQIALIDTLVQLQAKQSLDVLRRLAGDASQNKAVRQRAGWGVQKLS